MISHVERSCGELIYWGGVERGEITVDQHAEKQKQGGTDVGTEFGEIERFITGLIRGRRDKLQPDKNDGQDDGEGAVHAGGVIGFNLSTPGHDCQCGILPWTFQKR